MKKLVFMCVVLIAFLLSHISVKAQHIDYKKDIERIGTKLSEKHPDPYNRPYIYKNEPSVLKKINPVNIVFGATIYIYQNVFSRHISSRCLYTPSCSEFSKDAIREFGIVKGTFLSADRINRCSFFAAMDLKNRRLDPKTQQYPDPVSRYKKVKKYDGS